MANSKAWAGILLVVAFATGATVGGAGMSAWRNHNDHRRRPSYAERLQAELDLTKAQRDSVDAIIKVQNARFRPIAEESRARFDSLWEPIRTEIRAQIAGVLTETQRQKYQAITARYDSTRRARDTAGAHAH